MEANNVETLPWIDYREVITKLEERGRAEGKAEGKAEHQMVIAQKAFKRLDSGGSIAKIISELEYYGIPTEIIESAKKQVEAN
jgi:predicted transposase YdaD